jgi:hypothetical protein
MAKISYKVANEYFMGVFSSWFVDHEDPPSRPEDFRNAVQQFKLKAQKFGDLEYLRVAVEHILANPDIDQKILMDFSFNDDYAFEPEEVLRILAYLYGETWPSHPQPKKGQYPSVEWLHGLGWEEWQRRKAELNPELNGKLA